MSNGEPPAEAETHTVERTFTVREVRRFAALSGDDQPRHTEPDEEGRLMVQGLLTATLPTEIGGELEVLAHTMEFEFHRPVYTGETVTCTWTNEHVEAREDRHDLTAGVVCETDGGKTVLSGTVEGLVYRDRR